jgi:hypothetical protein
LAKKIELEWPEIGVKVTANLLEQDEPEMCGELWNNLKNPLKMVCRHTVSTGRSYGAESRPPKHPVKTGTQAQPLGRKRVLLSKAPPGSIGYSISGGYGGINLCYGPCTEPLPATGPVVATVESGGLDDFVRAGNYVWNAQYMTHTPAIMIARRKE